MAEQVRLPPQPELRVLPPEKIGAEKKAIVQTAVAPEQTAVGPEAARRLGITETAGRVVQAMQTPDDMSVVLPRRRQASPQTIRARAERLQEQLRVQKDTPSLAIQQVYQVRTQSEFEALSPEDRAKRIDEHIKKVTELQPPHSALAGLSASEAKAQMASWLEATERLDDVKSSVGWQIQEAGRVTATIEISQFHQKATQMSNLIKLREVADRALMSNIELAMGLERISAFKASDWTDAVGLIPFMLLGEARAPTRIYLYQGRPFDNPVLAKEADRWITRRHLETKEAGKALNSLLGREVMSEHQQYLFSRMKSAVRPIASIIAQQFDQIAAIAAKPTVFAKALGGRVEMRDAEGKINRAAVKAVLDEELAKYAGMKTHAVTEAILHEFVFKLLDLGVVDEAIPKENARTVDITQAK